MSMEKIVKFNSVPDMKNFVTVFLLHCAFLALQVHAQNAPVKKYPTKEEILNEGKIGNVFYDKFRWGFSYNFLWGTIVGDDLPDNYFVKPNVGFNVRAEYYPVSFLGLGAGFGYQQRGAGIYNVDVTGGGFSHPWVDPVFGDRGDPDSTHLERLRFKTWELPVTILLRTPKDVFKDIRLSGAVGIVWIHTTLVNDVFMDIVGGMHDNEYITNQYQKNMLGYQVSFGADINAGDSNVFQVHLVYNKTMKNIYAAGQGDGRLVNLGVRVAWLL